MFGEDRVYWLFHWLFHWVFHWEYTLCLAENVGLIFPMIASHLKTGLSDQQNHWVQWGTRHFQTHLNSFYEHCTELHHVAPCLFWETIWHILKERIHVCRLTGEDLVDTPNKHLVRGCKRCGLHYTNRDSSYIQQVVFLLELEHQLMEICGHCFWSSEFWGKGFLGFLPNSWPLFTGQLLCLMSGNIPVSSDEFFSPLGVLIQSFQWAKKPWAHGANPGYKRLI